jgi:hypothetical protein
MITQKFDISKKPLLDDDNVAYLVDSKNVKMHRQYVEKYYGNHEVNWFDANVMREISNNRSLKLIFYYKPDAIAINYNIKSSRAYHNDYTIYYVTNALMIVE